MFFVHVFISRNGASWWLSPFFHATFSLRPSGHKENENYCRFFILLIHGLRPSINEGRKNEYENEFRFHFRKNILQSIDDAQHHRHGVQKQMNVVFG